MSKKEVVMRKVGGFYQSFDDDSYVLYELLHYKINHGKLGFPVSIKNKVQNILEEKKINYCFKIKEGVEEMMDFKKLNRYQEYLKRGISNYNIEKERERMQEKIRELPQEKVEQILSYIESVVNE